MTNKPLQGLQGSGAESHTTKSKRKNRKDKAMDEEERVIRLQKKLEHWIEHNKEHAESFRKAAREAEELGLVDISMRLNDAAKDMEGISALLEKAMNELA